MNWEIPQAEQQFSELVQAALLEPQPIYKHDRLMAFMVKADLFQEFLDWQQRKTGTTATGHLNEAPLPRKGRKPGSAVGQIWMSDDFDEPLEDFQEYME